MKLSFNGRLFRDTLFGHGFRNQKLDCFKRWSGCEEVRALLLFLRFFTSFATKLQQRISGDRSSPLFVSTDLVLVTL